MMLQRGWKMISRIWKSLRIYFCTVFLCIGLFSCATLPEEPISPPSSEEVIPEIEPEIAEEIPPEPVAVVKENVSSPVFSGSGLLGNIPYRNEKDTEAVVTISMWESGERRVLIEEAIEVFESLNPGVTVKAEFIDYSGYWGNIASDAAIGKLSDIIEMDRIHLSTFIARSLVVPIPSFGFSIPMGIVSDVMLYDKVLLDKLGITVKSPVTIDEIERIGEEVYIKKGIKTSASIGIDFLEAVAGYHGSDIYSEIKALDSSSTRRYFSILDRLESHPYFTTSLSGEAWNSFSPSNEIKEGDGTALIPYSSPYPYAYLSLTTENNEALVFLDWLLFSEEAGRIIGRAFGTPLSDSAYSSDVSIPPIGTPEIARKLTEYEAKLGKLSAEEAADEFVAEANRILLRAGGGE